MNIIIYSYDIYELFSCKYSRVQKTCHRLAEAKLSSIIYIRHINFRNWYLAPPLMKVRVFLNKLKTVLLFLTSIKYLYRIAITQRF